MGWTDEQKMAIDKRGQSILVAAAAGSGKTTVMVERILTIICDDNISLDEMLIVTFTNAAASEMREKIRKTIRKKLNENPELRQQLEILPRANISTFHSFALEVIRKYFYLTDLEASFRICDEGRGIILQEEVMDEFLQKKYEEGDPGFYDFLDRYSGEKNDTKLRELLMEIYKALLALPDPFPVLEQSVSDLGKPWSETKASRWMWILAKERIGRIVEALSRAQSLANIRDFPEAEDFINLSGIINSLKISVEQEEFDVLTLLLRDLKLPAFNKKVNKQAAGENRNQISALFEQVKEDVKKLREIWFHDSLENMEQEMAETAFYGETLLSLLKEYHQAFRKRKLEENVVDFNDIEHYCLEILRHPEVAEEYRKKFKLLFIDEYQDTSLTQEAIIQLISREDNVFMVGDIKQSIYKFRLAEPEIFKNKYDSFSGPEDVEAQKIHIDLNRNFRSKPNILAEVNHIFQPIMDGYDEKAMLYPGRQDQGDGTWNPVLYLLDEEELDGDYKSMSRSEREARMTAELIKEQIGNTYVDPVTQEEKIISYRDIVILMRSVANTSVIFGEVFKEQGIPVYIDESEEYFDRVEIEVFMNLLSVIDNRRQDVPLISILRSEIFGFRTEELAEIRNQMSEGSYADAFFYASETDSLLGRKCQAAVNQLSVWKTKSLSMPLGDFIWELLLDSGYYMISGAMPDGIQRQANLRILAEKAKAFSDMDQSTLYGFVRYIDVMKKRKTSTGQAKLLGENDDVVRIMTIHKSKGLEFPVVFVCGMTRNLRYSSAKNDIMFHKDVGLGIRMVNLEEHSVTNTLAYNTILEKLNQEEYEENIRVLYVALTRAKEKLFMTGGSDKLAKELEKKELGITSRTSFFGMMKNLPPLRTKQEEYLGLPQNVITQGEFTDETIFEGEPTEEEAAFAAYRLNYHYPYETAGRIRSKYSVSALNRTEPEQNLDRYVEEDERPLSPKRRAMTSPREDEAAVEINFDVPIFLQDEKKLTGAERGTVYHSIFERIDFTKAKNGGIDYVKEEIGRFLDQNILFQNEVDSLNPEKIAAFFQTDLGRRAADAGASGKLYREIPFSLRKHLMGEHYLVQGIIDCAFEEQGQLVLIDYKSNYVDPRNPKASEDHIRKQYEKQIMYYEEALRMGFGLPVKEAALFLIDTGTFLPMPIGKENGE